MDLDGCCTFEYRDGLGLFGTSIYTYFLQPGHDFGDRPLPLAPDYSDARFWAAWPGNASPAERLPPGVTAIPESERGADVFFTSDHFWRHGELGGTGG
ncbi:MAG: hypothetical protein CM15mP120_09800 [Pseudomonadota bacterium]|nr:MAG: hypothetical protein CM15mP120_09800 [Pseudomonadota bacterium]